jgi:NADP-dependent 3-hydroxy acid dehydrogenase YdfG
VTTDRLQKVIVITGASAGIGAALAEQVASRGASTVLAARRVDALESVAARCAAPTLVAPTDVTVRADVERLVVHTLNRFGRLDVWVNNAGQGISQMPSALTDDDVDEMMRVNVKSALYGMQAVLPHFKARGEGHVVNVSSLLGRMPLATFRSAYCGAKHFLNALTATFRAELRQTHPGIHFSLVSPGIVRTGFGLAARHGGPDSRALDGSQSAEEVARVIVDVIESKRTDVYTCAGSQEQVVDYYRALAEDP